MSSIPDYAELHCLSNFSFQRGASQPEELIQRAHALGYRALALTDECSVSGVVRAHTEARRLGLQFIPGAEFSVSYRTTRFTVVVLPHNLNGWGNLCAFISRARGCAPKGSYVLHWHDPDWATLVDCEILLSPPQPMEAAFAVVRKSAALWPGHVWLMLTLGLAGTDLPETHRLQQLHGLTGVPLVAAGNVLMHVRSRKPLHDVLTAIRSGIPVSGCGVALMPNGERHLRRRDRLAGMYPAGLLEATLIVASRCTFSLEMLRYQYPMEAVLPGQTPSQTLRQYTFEGAALRYPAGVPDKVRLQIERELELIAALRYEMYFLTVHDLVRFARSRDILCQGRGSAANSAVCYCLGVTEVDPSRINVLFERFISRERDEPPDIDVDFEHQRREEVIQYIYLKYGRERAAITAVVTTYRPRSALRDVGRALQIPEGLVAALCKEHPGMYGRAILADRLGAALDKWSAGRPEQEAQQVPGPRALQLWLEMATELQRFPRHLSQHVGGFVLTQGPLTRLVPVENAAMKDRSVIQWEKDDLDAVGLLKVDVLALGMLSAIRRCLALISRWRGGPPMRMQDVPAEDPDTYEMICQADTVGVFQIESRAQMSMLPRLKPRKFYDLVVEVAIVRPGPIQGGMVHPFLKARQNPESVQLAHPDLEDALRRTHGVPIFQEQVMQVAMAAASFTGGEADALRRSMAAWKRSGGVHKFYDRLVGGMLKNGYTREYADQLFKQIEGFGEYGFPESHAASFALLVYVSCWLKRHHPGAFLAAMLNSQPLGFYGPAQLVQDARRHHVEVRPVDVQISEWDCTLEKNSDLTPLNPAVRLGLCMVSGFSREVAERLVRRRAEMPFGSTQDMALRCQLDAADLKALAGADALFSLSGHRRQQVWDASALQAAPALLKGVPVLEDALALPAAPEGEEVVFDYAATGLTLRSHPLQLLRGELAARKILTAADMAGYPSGRLVRACGIVTARQQPGTAKGVVFITLEDETGSVNVIVWRAVKEKFRDMVYQARLMAVYGIWQRDDQTGGQVRHVIAKRLVDLTPMLGSLSTRSRDFH